MCLARFSMIWSLLSPWSLAHASLSHIDKGQFFPLTPPTSIVSTVSVSYFLPHDKKDPQVQWPKTLIIQALGAEGQLRTGRPRLGVARMAWIPRPLIFLPVRASQACAAPAAGRRTEGQMQPCRQS